MTFDPVHHEDVQAAALADPSYAAEWNRTALARAVAVRVVAYRAEHDLSQRALAALLGMKQPQVVRLESGDVNPSINTLARLAERLGIEIAIDIRPSDEPARLIGPRSRFQTLRSQSAEGAATIAIATT